MIKVSIEFKSVDEAIVALGKLVGGQLPKAVESAAPITPVAGPPTTARKGRADKGKPRGSYKNVAAPEGQLPSAVEAVPPAPVAAAPQTAAPQDASPVAPTEKPAVAAVPKAEDAQAALEKLFETKGLEAAREVMARFGVKRLRDLKEDRRIEFIADANKVLEVA